MVASGQTVPGECLLVQGRIAEAERLLAAGLPRLEETVGPTHERSRAARQALEKVRRMRRR